MIRAECKRPLEEDEDEEEEERDEFYPDGPPPAKTSSSSARPKVINLLEMDYFKSITEQTPTQVRYSVLS